MGSPKLQDTPDFRDGYFTRSVQSDVQTVSMNVLTDLSLLRCLYEVDRDLIVERNRHLISLAGLEKLTSLVEGIQINDMDGLTELSALDQLTSIGGYLELLNNAPLTDLHNIELIDSHLSITAPSLATSDTEAVVGEENIGNRLTISGNAE